MAHFAKVEDGVVTQVIVADSQQWCEANLGGTWVQTSYNTHGGVNNRVGGENLRKNYAGIGYHYDGSWLLCTTAISILDKGCRHLFMGCTYSNAY
jgi:hypothetical protein